MTFSMNLFMKQCSADSSLLIVTMSSVVEKVVLEGIKSVHRELSHKNAVIDKPSRSEEPNIKFDSSVEIGSLKKPSKALIGEALPLVLAKFRFELQEKSIL